MKKISISILTAILIICCTTIVKAADTFGIKFETNTTNVNKGNTVTLDFYVDNISVNSEGKGIAGIQGVLDFDTKKFEFLSLEAVSGWDGSYNEGAFMIDNKSNKTVSSKTLIAKINLKVIGNANSGETTVKIRDITGTTGKVSIKIPDYQFKLNVVEKATDNKKQEETKTDDNTKQEETKTDDNTKQEETKTDDNTKREEIKKDNNTKQEETKNNSNTNTTKTNTAKNATTADNTTSKEKLPKTGVQGISLVVIGVTLIAGYLSYLKYSKYKGVK